MDEQGTHDGDELVLAPANVISRKRPKALWGVLAAVAVAAGALVATSGVGEDETAPRLPIALGSAAGGRQESSAADSMLAWVTYVPGDDLPALGGEAPAYKLSGTIEDAQVRALADALGLEGDPTREGGGWRILGAGGATLEVYEEGGASWWFSAGSPDVAVGHPGTGGGVDDCVETSAEGGTVSECTLPMPYEECPPNAEVAARGCPGPVEAPADLPSEDEARSIARDLLAVTGIDTDDAVVTVDGPFDAWYVSVEPRIDGVPAGLLATVAVGAAGAITSAGGHLGTPERLGDYPLLDTRAAIDRLNAQMGGADRFSYSPGGAREVPVASDGDEVTVDDTTTLVPTTIPLCKVQADGSEICEVSGSGEAPTPVLPECPDLVPPGAEPLAPDAMAECVDVMPVPLPMPEPQPEPEPTEVVLTGATRTLVLVPANDGSADAYLVPGYRFTGEGGAQVDAPALADASLAEPAPTEPPVTGTPGTSIAPDPGDTDGGSTPPAGCETLVEEDPAGTTDTIQPCVGVDPTEPVRHPVDIDPECDDGSLAVSCSPSPRP